MMKRAFFFRFREHAMPAVLCARSVLGLAVETMSFGEFRLESPKVGSGPAFTFFSSGPTLSGQDFFREC